MNQTLFLSQLRVIILVAIAFAAGKGWLSSADSSAITAILTPLGVIAGPWIWSIYSNINSKIVPQHAVVIDPVNTPANADKPTATVQTASGTMTGKVVSVLLVAFVLSAFLANGSAQAQIKQFVAPTGNFARDLAAAQGKPNPASPGLTGNPLGDIIGALDVKLLPDLQYALKLATASGSKVTGPCYQAWIDIINVRQKAVQDDATPPQALPMPDPHLVTDFEKLVELRNSLQPDSEFMIKCSPVASMVKKDIVGFIGIVISGGAGLATLVPGL